MNPNFGSIGSSFSLLLLFKVLIIILSGFYVLFSIIVVRQIAVMKKTLITPFSANITVLGWLHFLFATGVLLLFLFFVQP
ncbi:MAG: hypothetical protein COU63_01095 [Candidatus Pacebacteria bacterium CG10_big_fil_rev_8_21_14_0_10_36_11]|nr:hypothetical protein [Candidatus Pacearchaeota archaeon]OIP73815.1 MAG: hypothetical protein AUK08_04625 [Candidatus Pacebacteria bacterium CG2_30_36_39]PIR64599.1 MAG: hypothetical protein COU63_01095 [Candidatus Pacebacteria bacterium CG10_big_fil_rev_8_21_14_0_10_36_11]PJC42391.1 MAG: hypothetical protein CO040_04765 [Candidatus Pacebacteria bacterium CG_4_9_14_0_2_um_filter_36_8]